MTAMDPFTLNLLANDEVFGGEPGSAGQQAVPVRQEPGVEVWARTLADGSKAVGLFNTGAQSPLMLLSGIRRSAVVRFPSPGMNSGSRVPVRSAICGANRIWAVRRGIQSDGTLPRSGASENQIK
jgi:hypothetical protein